MRLRSLVLTLLCILTIPALAQGPRQPLTPEETKALIEKRESIEKQLEDIAIEVGDFENGSIHFFAKSVRRLD